MEGERLIESEEDMNSQLIQNQITSSCIIDQDNDLTVDIIPEKRGCCSSFFYYLFCCCCCKKQSSLDKETFRKKWKHFLKKEKEESADIPFMILTNLYANENVIEDLEKIRLNPNFVSEVNLRNDLEFYIPQLCTFLLFGEMKTIEEFFVFLCKVCSTSFFFAHRVHWFLASMIDAAEESKNEEIINIIKMISTLFKSENSRKNLTLSNFYLVGSEEYIDFINENGFNCLYSLDNEQNLEKCNSEDFQSPQKEIIQKFKNSRKLINEYCDSELAEEINKLKKIDDNIQSNSKFKKLSASDFFINISHFDLENDQDRIYNDNDKDKDDIIDCKFIDGSKKSFENDLNFISYQSSINFIDHLCDISNEMAKLPVESQKEYLFSELKTINKLLPCNVYLPFLKESTRNYFICHIPISGAKIFRTKTRAPIMLTFELIRLNEVTNEIQNNGLLGNLINPRKNSINDSKCNLTLTQKIEVRNEDELISKPMVLELHRKNSDPNETTSNQILGAPVRKDNSELFQVIKNKFLQVKQGVNKMMRREMSKTIYIPSDNIPTKKTNNDNDNENENVNETIKINPLTNSELVIPIVDRAVTQYEREDIPELNIKEGETIPEITINNGGNNEIDLVRLSNIFGEKIKDYHKRVKDESIFGGMESHKIFKAIIKTNEDLRQEQFATQLINEFYQIFQISKVKCWLNTYEIISTGNNSGLIEMVPDSLSLDQLKQKTNRISLRNFYLYYFGKGNEKSRELQIAMKNFVNSLAGYSLVCYFLQIKDRHNGNILIDAEGHIIHIDFGFLLSNAPGKGLKFETAPFKLTSDMVDCLGGRGSKYYKKYVKRLRQGFAAISKHRDKIIILVEMMWCGHGKNLPCFEGKQEAIDELKRRLLPEKNMKPKSMNKFVDELINQSYDNWRTKFYDYFQYKVQGIYY